MTERIPKITLAHYRNGELEILNKDRGVISHEAMSREEAIGRIKGLGSAGRVGPYGSVSGEILAINPVHVRKIPVSWNSTYRMDSFQKTPRKSKHE